MDESYDSNENQIDGEQKHSEIFGDVHESFLKQAPRVCTPKKAVGAILIRLSLRKGEERVGVYSFFTTENGAT